MYNEPMPAQSAKRLTRQSLGVKRITMNIELIFQPNYEDIRNGKRLRLGITRQTDLFGTLLIIIILLVPIIFLIYKIFSITDSIFYQVACWTSIVVSIFIIFLVFVHSETVSKESFEKDRIFYENYKITMDDENIIIYTKYSTNKIPWTMIQIVKENMKSILFLWTKQCAINIPKRILSKTDEEIIRNKIETLQKPYQFSRSE